MVTYAKLIDIKALSRLDKHIARDELRSAISKHRIYATRKGNEITGFLRYNLFWDNTPFMNMLFIVETERNCGIGKELVLFWEREMINKGYDLILTSTPSNEDAQHFFRKLGYTDCGFLNIEGDPQEIIMSKYLKRSAN